MLFTSGSTGEPKGVTMPHRALANLITWQNRRRRVSVGGSTLQFAPLSFECRSRRSSRRCAVADVAVVDRGAAQGSAATGAPRRRRGDRARVSALRRVAGVRGGSRISARTRLASLRVVIIVGEQLAVTPEIRRLCAANPDVSAGEPVRPDRNACGGQLSR